jgi:hypothetical protein
MLEVQWAASPAQEATPPRASAACPICGVDQPHDHDEATKYDWANRPWLVRARPAVTDRTAFEAFVSRLLKGDDWRHSYVGRLYFWKYGFLPTTWAHFDEVYSDPVTAALWHAWNEGASHAFTAVREQTPTAQSIAATRAAPTPEASAPEPYTPVVLTPDLVASLVEEARYVAARSESPLVASWAKNVLDFGATVAALTAERTDYDAAMRWLAGVPDMEPLQSMVGRVAHLVGTRHALEARLRDAEQTISALPTFESVDGGVCVNRTAALLALAARASQRGAP